MKLNHKIKINLLDFIKTGKFDYVTLGKTKEWMENNFPEPDFKHTFKKSSALWGYGDFEIYFTNDETSMIYTDRIETLESGNHLEIDKSIFGIYEKCTLVDIQSKFNEIEIDYQVKHLVKLEQVILKISKSNVELSFGFYDEKVKKENYELLSIHLTSPAYFQS